MNAPVAPERTALHVARDEIQRAVAATKCHACGCLRQTIDAIEAAGRVVDELAPALRAARQVFVPRKYDCLGCETCYPALAANAFVEAFPGVVAAAALCPTETVDERSGWPPLPGDYNVVRYRAPVAVCTLNSEDLAKDLSTSPPGDLAIVGTLHTENLGIERIIRNLLANPNIRFLILCGDDTQRLVGHLPGQSLESLFANGIDEGRRIVGAKGKRPFLKNITPAEIRVFLDQVRLVPMTGESDAAKIRAAIAGCSSNGLPAFASDLCPLRMETVHAEEPQFHKPDPAGYFVVYPDRRAGRLVLEHYTNAGVLSSVLDGSTPTALYMEAVKRGLLSQLDHAAYLGRELEAAARSLRTGEQYVQDAAPGKPTAPDKQDSGSCGPSCSSCHPAVHSSVAPDSRISASHWAGRCAR